MINQNTDSEYRRISVFFQAAFLSILLAVMSGCDSKVIDTQANGETHWMRQCSGNDTCGVGLDCLCGICTMSCDSIEPMACSKAPEKSVCISDKLQEGLGCVVETAKSLCLPDCEGGCEDDSKCVDGACVPNFVLDQDPAAPAMVPVSDSDNTLLSRGYKSGSRLKAVTISRKDLNEDEGVFKKFYDTKLEVECQFIAMRDGVYRCIPTGADFRQTITSYVKLPESELRRSDTAAANAYEVSPYYDNADCEGGSVGVAISDNPQVFSGCPAQNHVVLALTQKHAVIETVPSEKTYYHLDASVDPPTCLRGLLPEDDGKSIYDINIRPDLSEFVTGTPSIVDLGMQETGGRLGAITISGSDDSAIVNQSYDPDIGPCVIGHLSEEGYEWYTDGGARSSYCLPSNLFTMGGDSAKYFAEAGCEGEAFNLGYRYVLYYDPLLSNLQYVYGGGGIYQVKDIEPAKSVVHELNADGTCVTRDFSDTLGYWDIYFFHKGDQLTTGFPFPELNIKLSPRGGLLKPMVVASDGSSIQMPLFEKYRLPDSAVVSTDPDASRQCYFYYSETLGEFFCLPESRIKGEYSLSSYFSDAACTVPLLSYPSDDPKPTRGVLLDTMTPPSACEPYWGENMIVRDIVPVGEPHTGETVYLKWTRNGKTRCTAENVSSRRTYYTAGLSLADTIPRFVQTVED